MNIEKARVHYLSMNDNPIVRNKPVFCFDYKGYNLYILEEEKMKVHICYIKMNLGNIGIFIIMQSHMIDSIKLLTINLTLILKKGILNIVIA